MMSWAEAETTILQGKIEEISFDFYVRAFTFRRADNSTLRSWLVQAQNFLLAMGSKDLKLCDRDKVAFVLRNVSPREMEKFSRDALDKGITPMLVRGSSLFGLIPSLEPFCERLRSPCVA